MIEVHAIKLTGQMEAVVYDKLMGYLPEKKQEKIRRFVRYQDAQRSLLADVLMRTVISSKLSIRNNEILFFINEYGKPFLRNADNFNFNLSHAGEWVVCAIDSLPIGIDVEKIQPIDFDIAERFFSREECFELSKRDGIHKLRFFYDLWTLKESYIKAVGKGLSIPLDSFTISFEGNSIRVSVTCNSKYENLFFKQYEIDSSYKLSVCSATPAFPYAVILKNVDDLVHILDMGTKFH